jgi:prolyl oligopeptidase
VNPTRVILALLVSALPALAQSPAEAGKLRDVFADDWEFRMRESPTWASTLGDRRFNDRWGEPGEEAVRRRHAHQDAVRARLKTIDRDKLPPADRLNYDLFRRELEQSIDGRRFRWHLIALNQRGGIQTANELADSIRFETVKDYEDWVARLRGFPEYMDKTIGVLRAGIAAKMTLPKVVIKRLPEQIAGQIIADAAKSPFYKPFRRFPPLMSDADRKRLSAEAGAAISDGVIPAYRKFAAFFRDEYLPACYDEIGAHRMPDGAVMYAHVARRYTTTNLTPQEIHDIGLSEVRRIRARMDEVIRQVGFQGSFDDFLNHLRTDPKFYYTSGAELLAAYRALCKRIDPALVKVFRTFPRMPYGVEPIPDLIAPHTTTAYYMGPAADGSRAGTYYVNLFRPETRPRYEMMALSLHEGVPGHHFQIALAQELGELPNFRKYGGYTAFIEGWGLYAESLGEDLGLYEDPYSMFGRLTYEMWRACRLVVDTGMHALGWDRKRAIDFMLANAAKSELDITNEIDRYISWPGQALAYKIGELKIQELRRRAAARLGAKFDIKEFHDVVLGRGAVPLDVLEAGVEEWLRGK